MSHVNELDYGKKRGHAWRPFLFSEITEGDNYTDADVEARVHTKSDRRRNGESMIGERKGNLCR